MERSNGIFSLPDSVLQAILLDLDTRRKLELQRVCRRFLDIMPFSKVVLDHLPLYVFESMSSKHEFCPRVLKLHKDFSDKDVFSAWRGPNASLNAARSLSETFPQMRTLVLTICTFELKLLQFLPNLKSLTVGDVQIRSFVEEDQAPTRSVLRKMTWFHVRCGITWRDLKTICSEPLGCFRKVEVKGWRGVQKNIEWMGIHLPKLRVLAVTGCRLSWISEAFQLQQLEISDGYVDVEVLPEAISKSLVVLRLGSAQKVTGYGFLKRIGGLRELVVRDRGIGTCDLENVMLFRCLTGIDLSNTDAVTDDLLDILRQCRYPIRALVANNHRFVETGFTTAGVVRYLEWATCLEKFFIWGHHRVTDRIFSAGGRFPETLTSLGIEETGCTMDGVLAFRDRRAALKRAGRFVPNIIVYVLFARKGGGVTTFDSFSGFTLSNMYEDSSDPSFDYGDDSDY